VTAELADEGRGRRSPASRRPLDPAATEQQRWRRAGNGDGAAQLNASEAAEYGGGGG